MATLDVYQADRDKVEKSSIYRFSMSGIDDKTAQGTDAPQCSGSEPKPGKIV